MCRISKVLGTRFDAMRFCLLVICWATWTKRSKVFFRKSTFRTVIIRSLTFKSATFGLFVRILFKLALVKLVKEDPSAQVRKKAAEAISLLAEFWVMFEFTRVNNFYFSNSCLFNSLKTINFLFELIKNEIFHFT